MMQRSQSHADTYSSSTIRLRRKSHCMGRARRLVMLASVSLLACHHERVDLGGLGAGGSPVVPAATGGAGSPPYPAPDVSGGFIVEPTPPRGSRPLTAPLPKPSFATLITLPEPLPAISGGTLAVAADGGVAVATDSERDLIYLVDIAAGDTKLIALPTGSEPGRVVLDDLGQAHVVLRNAGQLARIELASARTVLSGPICQQPRGLAFRAATQTVHVACADGQLMKLSAATHEILEPAQVHSPDLRDVVVDASGGLVITRFRDPSFWLPERAAPEITLPTLRWPVLEVGSTSSDPARWVSTRATFAFRTLPAVDGSVWMLHERAQIDPLEGDDFRGARSQCGPAVHAALTQLDPEGRVIQRSLQLQDVSAPAVDFALSPSGTWIAVAMPSAFAAARAGVRLYRIDTLIDEASIDRHAISEFPPSAVLMCIGPSTTGMVFDTQAVAVAFDDNDTLYVQGRYPAYLHVIPTTTNGKSERIVRLHVPPARDLGHEWFHAELGDSRVSCAACHAEGCDDAHVWQTSKGPRRTPSLRGGLAQTAPFTWSGEHASLDSVIKSFADPSVPLDAVSGIGAWLDKLMPLTLTPASEAKQQAAESGKKLFESAQLGCTECHTGPKLTNNQSVDVGTGGAFQVPSLLGLGLRAPYMHDGCAKDLQAVFGAPDCGHSSLAMLSREQAADLLAYLHSL